MTETMRMEIPQDILAALKTGIQDFSQHMRVAAAIACFQKKKLSLGKATQLAGYNRLDFLDLLAEKGIVAFDCDESFTESELQGVSRLADIKSGRAEAIPDICPDETISNRVRLKM
jgi:predicted HTH domain antitoxin